VRCALAAASKHRGPELKRVFESLPVTQFSIVIAQFF
jgi:hypothetical protein